MAEKPSAKPTAATTPASAGDAFKSALSLALTGAWTDTIAKITDKAKAEKASKALADLADLTTRAKLNPEQADALQKEAAFPVATLANVAAESEAQVRARWRQAAWATAQSAAHLLASFAVPAL